MSLGPSVLGPRISYCSGRREKNGEGAALRVLVTGAAGFIGSAVVRHVAGLAHASCGDEVVEVIAFDSLERTGSWLALSGTTVPSTVSIVTSSIHNELSLGQAMSGVDVVIHCAAETSVDASFMRI